MKSAVDLNYTVHMSKATDMVQDQILRTVTNRLFLYG